MIDLHKCEGDYRAACAAFDQTLLRSYAITAEVAACRLEMNEARCAFEDALDKTRILDGLRSTPLPPRVLSKRTGWRTAYTESVVDGQRDGCAAWWNQMDALVRGTLARVS